MNRAHDYSFHAMLRGIILIGFFLLIFKLIMTGDIRHFIAPKMVPFSYFSIAVLFILGVMQVWRSGSDNIEDLYCNCGFDHNQNGSFFQSIFIYALFILPVISGMLFPNNVLDSSVVAKRGVKYGSGEYSEPRKSDYDRPDTSLAEQYLEDPDAYMKNLDKKIEEEFNSTIEGEEKDDFTYGQIMTTDDEEKLKSELLNSEKIFVDDDRYVAILDIFYDQQHLFVGKEVEVTGFVYKEPEFKENQLVIARFGISCCVADAVVYGIFSTMENAQNVKEDEWVKVTGTLSTTHFQDSELPYLQISHVEKVEQPENPYVYEMLKLLVE